MATLELFRQVELRHQVGSSGQRLRTADPPNVGISLRGMLRADRERWTGRAGLPEEVEDLLREGGWIDTQYQRGVARDRNSLIAPALVEELKTDERMRAAFLSRTCWQTRRRSRSRGRCARDGAMGEGGRRRTRSWIRWRIWCGSLG